MNCPDCGRESNRLSRICPFCGAAMNESGMRRTGQAQLERVYPKARPEPSVRRGQKSYKSDRYYARRFAINWAHVLVALLALSIVAGAAFFAYLHLTHPGQVILARKGKEATPQAYWTVATEYLNTGDIPRAVENFEYAKEIDYEASLDAGVLSLQAEAYEAALRPQEAVEVYYEVVNKVRKQDSDSADETTRKNSLRILAYRNIIRVLKGQGFVAEAAEVMKEAYQETGNLSFKNERAAIVPAPPVATLAGGRHMGTIPRSVSFISDKGYDVYYCTGDEVLPEEGTLFTEPIPLPEGVYIFRAVAVSRDLISDEMLVKYTIALPVPMAPRTNVLTGEYDKPIRVKLRNVDEDKNLRFFYTIDGSRPTVDSPEFTGEDIYLGPGRIRLRAISLNEYGKTSNELIMEYKIAGTFERYYHSEDSFPKFRMMNTDMEAFKAAMGEPQAEELIEDPAVSGESTKLTYSWGEARFTRTDRGILLYYLFTNDAVTGGPRNTQVGMKKDDVIAKFRDMGQVQSPNGDRGLYVDTAVGYGAYEADQGDISFGRIVYCFNAAEGSMRGGNKLTYNIHDDVVASILCEHTEAAMDISR